MRSLICAWGRGGQFSGPERRGPGARACARIAKMDQGGYMAEIVERALQILMAIQAIGIPGYTNTVHPANYFASSV